MYPGAPNMTVTAVWATLGQSGVGLALAQTYVRQYSNQPPPSPIASGIYLFAVTINLGFAVGSTLATAVIDGNLRVLDATPAMFSLQISPHEESE